MRPLRALPVLLVVVAGCLSDAPDPDTGGSGLAPVVTHVAQVDAERWSGEPSILVLEDGTILITGVSGFTRYAETPDDAPCRFGQSYIWRSTDQGVTWDFVDHALSPHECVFYRNAIMGIEGDLARDDAGRAYFVDLTFFPGVNGLSVSDDSGSTWTAVQNPVVGFPATDRPWVAAHGDGEVWVKYLTQVSSPVDPTGATAPWRVTRSTDAGMTFLEDVPLPACSQADMYVDASGGWLLLPCDAGGEVSVLRTALGAPMAWERLPVAPMQGQSAGGFPGVAGEGGRWAVAWVEHTEGTNRLFLATTSDAGATWSDPLQVSAPGTSVSFPWIDVEGGKLALVWYEAGEEGDPNDLDTEWHVMHATIGFTDGVGDMHVQRITDEPVHIGSICDAGLGCVLQDRAEDRRLLDFFEVDVAHGVSHVTWTSTQGDVPTVWYGRLAW